MNDRDIRLECLRLAMGSMPIPGVPDKSKSETVLESAQKYYEFVWAGPIIGNRPKAVA